METTRYPRREKQRHLESRIWLWSQRAIPEEKSNAKYKVTSGCEANTLSPKRKATPRLKSDLLVVPTRYPRRDKQRQQSNRKSVVEPAGYPREDNRPIRKSQLIVEPTRYPRREKQRQLRSHIHASTHAHTHARTHARTQLQHGFMTQGGGTARQSGIKATSFSN